MLRLLLTSLLLPAVAAAVHDAAAAAVDDAAAAAGGSGLRHWLWHVGRRGLRREGERGVGAAAAVLLLTPMLLLAIRGEAYWLETNFLQAFWPATNFLEAYWPAEA
jgi:hypothetical protein